MSSIKTYSCKYCDIDGLKRIEFIKHTKTEDHKTLMEDVKGDETMRQIANYFKKAGYKGLGKTSTTIKELIASKNEYDEFYEKNKKNKKNKKKKKK